MKLVEKHADPESHSDSSGAAGVGRAGRKARARGAVATDLGGAASASPPK